MPEQIKDEIRKLSRIDKIEIYRWIDEEAPADLLSRIGVLRNRTEVQGDDPKAFTFRTHSMTPIILPPQAAFSGN